MKRYFITASLVLVLLAVIAVRIPRRSHSQGLSVGIVTTQCGPQDNDITAQRMRWRIHDDGSPFINLHPVPAGQLGCWLCSIYETRNQRILFFGASDVVPYEQAVNAIEIVQSAVPDLKVLLITPSTRQD